VKIERSIVAITGAGGGLGAAMAERLARQGARLALIDFRQDLLDKLKAGLSLPDEIAHTAQYLMENDFVNGRNIDIDGGMRL
jgi:NAD(P)-dependent dehydrogenase (short-subunit alcohol dehydrogenase family)